MKISELIEKSNLTEEVKYAVSEVSSVKRTSATADCLFFDLPRAAGGYASIPKFKEVPTATVTEDKRRFVGCDTLVIEVKNARQAYSYAYSKFMKINYSGLKIIGVTGTNGKTSVATMLKKILTKNGVRTGFIGTGKIESGDKVLSDAFYSMTSPDAEVLYPALRRMQEDGCTAVVMEVSSHALALDKVYPIEFDIGIFTGLSSEHMDFHKNMDDYFSEKEKLLKKSELGIVNYDDKYGKRLKDGYSDKIISVGIINQPDAYATDIEEHGFSGISYFYRANKVITPIKMKLSGSFNVYNSLLALTAARALSVPLATARVALSEIESIPGRFQFIPGEVNVILDYAHTPLALENVLKFINRFKTGNQNIIVVFGCGGERDKSKRSVMARIAENFADYIIITSDNPRGEEQNAIFADIVRGFEKSNHCIIYDRDSAIREAIRKADFRDIVVILGKGHEKYICDKNGYRYFNEEEIIKESLMRKK